MPERAGWLALALILDAAIGDPDCLWRRLKHPVVWIGEQISFFEKRWNKGEPANRRGAGLLTIALVLLTAVLAGLSVEAIAALLPFGAVFEIAAAAILLAQGSLAQHVRSVANGLAESLDAGRTQVARIVGRDPQTLDESGVARAAIESTAENFSDGVVAPALFYLIFGLPGLFAYKALNTADSMIGHLNERCRDFGFAAAKLDDVVNFIPARLSAVFLLAAALLDRRDWRQASEAAFNDAKKHRSPNAGWPEAVMAGALDLSLAGPRIYESRTVQDDWMHPAGRRQCGPADIHAALRLFWLGCAVQGVLVGLIWLLF